MRFSFAMKGTDSKTPTARRPRMLWCVECDCQALGPILTPQSHTPGKLSCRPPPSSDRDAHTKQSRVSFFFKAFCPLHIFNSSLPPSSSIPPILSELYAVVQFAVPGFLGTLKDFKQNYADPIMAQQAVGVSAAATDLREKLQRILIRR